MRTRATGFAERDLPSFTRAVIFACFFLSGATALAYEVVWLRMLSVVFGEAAHAVVMVLATFMGGLAIGSFCVSRLASRVGDALRTYAWIEIGVALSAGATPAGLWLVSAVSASLQRDLALPAGLVNGMVVAMLLLIPTVLMGATLPLLSQVMASATAPLGRPVGVLYAVNTGGAVVGAIAAGYGLLPAFGNRLTLAIAVAANLGIGLLVLGYSHMRPPAPADQAANDRARARSSSHRPLPLDVGLTVAALAVSGAVTMMYEVAWTRALALVIGSSTYAFTAMLVAFLLGIAGGSALYAWHLAVRHGSAGVFAALQVAIGLAGVAALTVYERMPTLLLAALGWSRSMPFVLSLEFAISVLLLLPTTLLAGAILPCAVSTAARGLRPAEDVGRLYALNTGGAVVGAVLGGLIMVPNLGVQGTLKVGIITNLIIAVIVIGATKRVTSTWRWAVAATAAVAAVGVAVVPPWDPRVLSSGPAIYATAYSEAASARRFDDILREQTIVFYRDGLTSSVSVGRDGGTTYLRINGKTDASTGDDMATQVMLGHLGLLFHPDPRRVLVIGLGAGITAGAVTAHPFERLDVVEIEPAVVEAARFFSDVQGSLLRDGRVRLVIADARSFVRTTEARYDVIVSEPSNPWVAGVSGLFTVEFFRLARERLAPGGTMVQWIHAYNLFPDDFRMVVNTFRTVFPSTTMWEPEPGDFLLLGRTDPAPLDLARLSTRFTTNAALRRDLLRLGIQAWPGVFALLSLGEAETARFAESARVNTEDRLPLEFSAPRALYTDTRENLRLIQTFRNARQPYIASARGLEQAEVQYSIGMTYLNRGSFASAVAHFQRALAHDRSFMPAMRAIALANTLARRAKSAAPTSR